MFTTRFVQQKEPWLPVLFAFAALGLALYYSKIHLPSLARASKLFQAEQDPCPSASADQRFDAMTAHERAYHERFMREAIAMVNLPATIPVEHCLGF